MNLHFASPRQCNKIIVHVWNRHSWSRLSRFFGLVHGLGHRLWWRGLVHDVISLAKTNAEKLLRMWKQSRRLGCIVRGASFQSMPSRVGGRATKQHSAERAAAFCSYSCTMTFQTLSDDVRWSVITLRKRSVFRWVGTTRDSLLVCLSL